MSTSLTPTDLDIAPRSAPRATSSGLGTDGLDVPRTLGRLDAPAAGPTLIVVGGLHGNEQAGVLALQRILPRLAADATGLERGRVIGLAGNRQALRVQRRYLSHDLNRHWLPDRVSRLRHTQALLADEDQELRELLREIEGLLAEAAGDVFLLDLHTTSGPEVPFVNLDDSLRNRPFAFALEAPVVLGLDEELAGTLASYVGDRGMVAVGFEAGQHGSPEAVERAEAAIWLALEASGVLRPGSRPEVTTARQLLKRECASLPRVVEVRYRHAIGPEDGFRMDPGYANFQPIQRDQHLGHDRRGPTHSPLDGLMLMPLYQAQGADGYFIVRPVRPIWLRASAAVRRWRLERFLHMLPGVQRHPENDGSFIVDRRFARWLVPQLFHLLGFSRQGTATGRHLVMTRRRYDRP